MRARFSRDGRWYAVGDPSALGQLLFRSRVGQSQVHPTWHAHLRASRDMAEETTSTAVAPAAPAKTKKAPHGTGNFLSRQLARRPKVSAMVMASIGAIGERDGASLLAIKKHMAGTYLVDVEKLSPFIHKYIMSAVAEGALLQTKGKGVNGSFKLAKKVACVAEKKTVAGGAKRKAPIKPKAKVTKKVKREEASLRKKPKMLAAK